MAGVHAMGDLAPRDVVSAAIMRRLGSSGQACVYLDATGLTGFADRFPTVYAACRDISVDPKNDPIPVSPAAHYSCGGVVTDIEGRTEVPGLYAAGEVARTGLHGANRLASNSLLEGLVMGRRSAAAIAGELAAPRGVRRAAASVAAPTLPAADRDLVQRTMTWGAAIGRDGAGLAAASDVIETAISACPPRLISSRGEGEDAALTIIAQAVLAAAGTRTESRGSHVRTDFPNTDDTYQRRSLLVRVNRGELVVQPDDETQVGAA